MATVLDAALPAFFNTDADFRSYGQKIHDAIVACGWVNTADTGQIDLTTVVKPALVSTPSGYKIYRSNDALHATDPIFIKIEFGSGATSIARPAMWVTTATGSDGAGTLTGQVGGRQSCPAAVTKAAGNVEKLYVSGDGGRLSLVCLDPADAGMRQGILIDRPRGDDGSKLAGFHFLQQLSNGLGVQTVPHEGVIQAFSNTNSGASVPIGVHKTGADINFYPFWAACGEPRPVMNFLYIHADLAGEASVQATVLGATRTLMPLGAGFSIASLSQQSAVSAPALAILWE